MPDRVVSGSSARPPIRPSQSNSDPTTGTLDGAGHPDAAWAALCTRLWIERDQLEDLLFKLTEVQLIVASGSTRWLNKADDEARRALESLHDTEVVRAVAVEELISQCGVESNTTLRELIAIAPSPWDSLLADHCEALRELALGIDAAANENRRRLQLGLDTTREALERVQSIRATYDARGDALAQRPGAYLLDQQA